MSKLSYQIVKHCWRLAQSIIHLLKCLFLTYLCSASDNLDEVKQEIENISILG